MRKLRIELSNLPKVTQKAAEPGLKLNFWLKNPVVYHYTILPLMKIQGREKWKGQVGSITVKAKIKLLLS